MQLLGSDYYILYIIWALEMKTNYRCFCTFFMYLLLLYQWQGSSPNYHKERPSCWFCDDDISLWLLTLKSEYFNVSYIFWRDKERLLLCPVRGLALHCSGKSWMWVQIDDSPHCWAITQQDTNHWWRRRKANRGVSSFPSLCCLTH